MEDLQIDPTTDVTNNVDSVVTTSRRIKKSQESSKSSKKSKAKATKSTKTKETKTKKKQPSHKKSKDDFGTKSALEDEEEEVQDHMLMDLMVEEDEMQYMSVSMSLSMSMKMPTSSFPPPPPPPPPTLTSPPAVPISPSVPAPTPSLPPVTGPPSMPTATVPLPTPTTSTTTVAPSMPVATIPTTVAPSMPVATTPTTPTVPTTTTSTLAPTLLSSLCGSNDPATNSSRDDALRATLEQVTDVSILSDPSTPQYRAYRFLLEVDPLQVDPCTAESYEVLERYGAAVLYYSTINGTTTTTTSWKNWDNWLTESSICLWFGLICSEEGSVTEIQLGKIQAYTTIFVGRGE
jgi:hypothetical protein